MILHGISLAGITSSIGETVFEKGIEFYAIQECPTVGFGKQ
jgi:hypothetical protein